MKRYLLFTLLLFSFHFTEAQGQKSNTNNKVSAKAVTNKFNDIASMLEILTSVEGKSKKIIKEINAVVLKVDALEKRNSALKKRGTTSSTKRTLLELNNLEDKLFYIAARIDASNAVDSGEISANHRAVVSKEEVLSFVRKQDEIAAVQSNPNSVVVTEKHLRRVKSSFVNPKTVDDYPDRGRGRDSDPDDTYSANTVSSRSRSSRSSASRSNSSRSSSSNVKRTTVKPKVSTPKPESSVVITESHIRTQKSSFVKPKTVDNYPNRSKNTTVSASPKTTKSRSETTGNRAVVKEKASEISVVSVSLPEYKERPKKVNKNVVEPAAAITKNEDIVAQVDKKKSTRSGFEKLLSDEEYLNSRKATSNRKVKKTKKAKRKKTKTKSVKPKARVVKSERKVVAAQGKIGADKTSVAKPKNTSNYPVASTPSAASTEKTQSYSNTAVLARETISTNNTIAKPNKVNNYSVASTSSVSSTTSVASTPIEESIEEIIKRNKEKRRRLRGLAAKPKTSVEQNEPTVVEPTLVEQNVVEPTVVKPAVIEQSVVEQSVVEPTIDKPLVVEQSVIERTVEESTFVKPAVVQPRVEETIVEKPMVVEQEVVEQKFVEPVVVQQRTVEPTVVEPRVVNVTPTVDPNISTRYPERNVVALDTLFKIVEVAPVTNTSRNTTSESLVLKFITVLRSADYKESATGFKKAYLIRKEELEKAREEVPSTVEIAPNIKLVLLKSDEELLPEAPKEYNFIIETTILGFLKESKDHTTLLSLFEAADLDMTVFKSHNYTLFAPTNLAFQKLPRKTLEALLLPENKEQLRYILKYHVLNQSLTTERMSFIVNQSVIENNLKRKKKRVKHGNRVPFKTLIDKDIIITVEQGIVMVKHLNGKNAFIENPDKKMSNGYVHIIDTVFLPN